MAADSLLNRINKMEFFAVLPAGFYCLIMIGFWFVAEPTHKNFMEALKPIAISIKDNPVYLIFLLFATYLFGSIFRALKVRWAERVYPPFTSRFPYGAKLKETLELIEKSDALKIDPSKLPTITDNLKIDVFNYWKDILCIKSQNGFEYYETFETRTRFSAGMLWAGVIGILSGLFMFIQNPSIAFQMLSISCVVYFAFGFHLRRVRLQESKALLFLYVAVNQP